MQRTILKIDGLFLMVMGTAAGVIDLTGYFTGKGPWDKTYFQNSVAIGGFEAHCLAAISGFILFTKAKTGNVFFFNKIAIAVHTALGVSNLIWFNMFVETDTLPMGYITTLAHFLFVFLHAMAIYQSSRRTQQNNL